MKHFPLFCLICASLAIRLSAQAPAYNVSNQSMTNAVRIVIGGNFSPDHLGPDEYDRVKKLVETHGILANAILQNEFLFKPNFKGDWSSLYIANLLELTSDNDPQGALSNAQNYEHILTEQLKEADQWSDLESRLKMMGMEEGNKIRRLLESRREVKKFIGVLEEKHPPLLPGHDLNPEDLITSAGAVFLGEFTDLGALNLRAAGVSVYRGSQVTLLEKWKGTIMPDVTYHMTVVWARDESTPDLKRHYILFVKWDGRHSGHIQKLEHATQANIEKIKALVSRSSR